MASFKIENGVLKIDDWYRAIIYLVLFIAIIRLVSLIIVFSTKSFYEFNFDHLAFIFVAIGFVAFSISVGVYQSVDNEIPLKNIIKLQPLGLKNTKRYYLFLKNGRKRHIVLNYSQAKLLDEMLKMNNIAYKKQEATE